MLQIKKHRAWLFAPFPEPLIMAIVLSIFDERWSGLSWALFQTRCRIKFIGGKQQHLSIKMKSIEIVWPEPPEGGRILWKAVEIDGIAKYNRRNIMLVGPKSRRTVWVLHEVWGKREQIWANTQRQ